MPIGAGSGRGIENEWLETNGAGAFAMGTVSGLRTRRYHNLLMHAGSPSCERIILVNGFDAWYQKNDRRVFLFPQSYQSGASSEEHAEVVAFDWYPWPTWRLTIPGIGEVVQELFMVNESETTVLRWRLNGESDGTFAMRPFLTYRDYHSLRRVDGEFDMRGVVVSGAAVRWQPYPGMPALTIRSNGDYQEEGAWYRDFLYTDEAARGYDCVEDAASPGIFTWPAHADAAWLVLSAAETAEPGNAEALTHREKSRRENRSRIELASSAYLVRRDRGTTIIAGYPWFTDWGRDTFIAMRGLCLAMGRYEAAEQILTTWADTVSEGMLPNRFPDDGAPLEYNSVDASLWFIVAAHDYLSTKNAAGYDGNPASEAAIRDAIRAIIDGYLAGTRHGIGMDSDALLKSGELGVALTWMDAVIEGRAITPRTGKAVEIQCLWINALSIGAGTNPSLEVPLARARRSFVERFWLVDRGFLADVVDADHEAGRIDGSLRPNQLLAVGGLPFPCVSPTLAGWILSAVERSLVTPVGVRTLSRVYPTYVGRYEGDQLHRDESYHQGTAWPWLMGPFVEGWLRLREFSEDACEEARRRFLTPWKLQLSQAGLGHFSEIHDGDEPYTPRGCPFQAWSMGEYLRVDRLCQTRGSQSKVEIWNSIA